MTCPRPVSWEDLVAYWAGDLSPAEVDRIDDHLMGCGPCSDESARVSALVEALRAFVPPIVTRAALEGLRARGARIEESTFAPGERRTVVFGRDVDLLIHRLAGLDLANATRVRVTVRVESTAQVIFEDPNAPFDAQEGVLVACQRHYAAYPLDTVFEVRAIETSGAERSGVYTILHLFPEGEHE
jgi:hypothetical protein